MISPSLKERFEELFVDDFTKEQYEQWKDENAEPKEVSKPKKFLHTVSLIMSFGILFSSIGYLFFMRLGSRVEQEVRDGNFVTYAWKQNEIVKSRYIPIEKLTDSLKDAQRKEAEDFLRILNK